VLTSGDSSSSATPEIKYDVGGSTCDTKPVGISCDGAIAYHCDADGALEIEDCGTDLCIDGSGCTVCVAGEFHCQGAKVMGCDPVAQTWTLLEVCNAAGARACNQATGTCEVSHPIGTNDATGTYYQFASFTTSASEFKGGYDVDGIDDELYVVRASSAIDVYQLDLLDSDADGVLEPNQHPDNPDATGPIEARTLTFVETIATPAPATPNHNELYLMDDRLYFGGHHLIEMIFNGATTTITGVTPWILDFANIGYDDIDGSWYAAGAGKRRVYQYDASDDTWGIAFDYPSFAGSHMDGMEVVTDPQSGIAYVYVSDMTSDFIGQYRRDRHEGWVQENVFEYAGTPAYVEGMGFGPLHHFWATGGPQIYELGGGDLASYTEPPS
jgi:hypothetical protein